MAVTEDVLEVHRTMSGVTVGAGDAEALPPIGTFSQLTHTARDPGRRSGRGIVTGWDLW